MIKESVTTEPGERVANPFDFRVLTFLAVATSINALAVGVTFAFLDVSIAIPVMVISIATFVLSLAYLIGPQKLRFDVMKYIKFMRNRYPTVAMPFVSVTFSAALKPGGSWPVPAATRFGMRPTELAARYRPDDAERRLHSDKQT